MDPSGNTTVTHPNTGFVSPTTVMAAGGQGGSGSGFAATGPATGAGVIGQAGASPGGGSGAGMTGAGMAASGPLDSTAASTGPRPSVLSLSIREKAALYAAYMPFVKGGGLFVPTTRPAKLGDEIYALVTLMDDPNKLPIPGRIVWITPAGTPGRGQGIGIQFAANEAGEEARARIENLIGGALKAARPTHTL